MKQLRLAVIGAGFMGALHARAIAETPFATLVAVADVDLNRAREVAQRFGAEALPDHHQLLHSAPPLDAVVVCTPESKHREPVVDAAAHGCAVLVEKPLADNLADADAMIAACRQHNVPLMVGYILRFEPAYAKLKEAVASGVIGRFLSGYARRNASITEGRRLGGRTSVEAYLAVHDVDQLCWYHDVPVRRVTAKAIRGRMAEEFGVADFVWILIEFADGGLGVIESGWGLPARWSSWQQPSSWNGFGDVEMNVIGTDGVVSVDLTPMNLLAVDNDEGWKFPDTRHWPVVHDRLGGAIRAEMDHFLQCVVTGASPLVDGNDGRRSLEIILAAEASLREDRAVGISSQ